MANPGRDSKLTVSWAFQDISIDVSDWTDTQDSDSHLKRSDIIYAVIHNHSPSHMRGILDTGWDVNEVLHMDLFATEPPCKTALQIASRHGWTEGVKMLFDAGASYMVSGIVGTPLQLALHNRNCPIEIIDLLLRNGADPNHHIHAGASSNTPGVLATPLQLALDNPQCPVDIIALLLKHGADPNHHSPWFNQIPLGQAIFGSMSSSNENSLRIIQLLLENGADPNVTGKLSLDAMGHLPLGRRVWLCPTLACPLSAVLVVLIDSATKLLKYGPDGSPLNVDEVRRLRISNAKIFKTLANFGGDVNWHVEKADPLLRKVEPMLHKMVTNLQSEQNNMWKMSLCLPEHFEIFYQNGGNINLEDGVRGTALECAVRECSPSNSVRWLIRHGAYIPPFMFNLLEDYFIPYSFSSYIPAQQIEETPLILLEAGMRVPQGTRMYLTNIEEEISSWQAPFAGHQGIEMDYIAFTRIVRAMWRLVLGEMLAEELGNTLRKHTFPEYLSTQMADLEEFSDESLMEYPEVIPERWKTDDEQKKFALDQIHRVLSFLSQPQSLQWHCRCCVRENLVSLQPSVVRMFPVPARLKRYILCHEV